MLAEALATHWPIEAIVLREDRREHRPTTGDWPVYLTDAATFERISTQTNPEGVLAVLPFLPQRTWEPALLPRLPEGPGYLLEDLQDPGNLGTIVRTADWFGFRHIVCSKGCVDLLNPKVLRSTMGSFFRVSVQYAANFDALVEAHLDTCWAADMTGPSLAEAAIQPQDWLLIGNEARGLSPHWRDRADLRKLHIPGAGGAESLNAAIAAAICGWQMFQRGTNPFHSEQN